MVKQMKKNLQEEGKGKFMTTSRKSEVTVIFSKRRNVESLMINTLAALRVDFPLVPLGYASRWSSAASPSRGGRTLAHGGRINSGVALPSCAGPTEQRETEGCVRVPDAKDVPR
ncbi:hypothetical protein DMN91_006627 [Ooceraea biroi]|uniref:Uncharacterized protein n=1 Tax=Ooceraea biroi TaxID=2015173 RepID=A0A3L8DI50_OOCBI|nr:hypothetical protein DMN91_006627 [Ooceraea biroi]